MTDQSRVNTAVLAAGFPDDEVVMEPSLDHRSVLECVVRFSVDPPFEWIRYASDLIYVYYLICDSTSS